MDIILLKHIFRISDSPDNPATPDLIRLSFLYGEQKFYDRHIRG